MEDKDTTTTTSESVRVVVRVRPLLVTTSVKRKKKRGGGSDGSIIATEVLVPETGQKKKYDNDDDDIVRVKISSSTNEHQVFHCDCAIGPDTQQADVFEKSGKSSRRRHCRLWTDQFRFLSYIHM